MIEKSTTRVVLSEGESRILDYAINKILLDICCIYDNYCCKGCPLAKLCNPEDMCLPHALDECISKMEVE